jgi:hypothetical protein
MAAKAGGEADESRATASKLAWLTEVGETWAARVAKTTAGLPAEASRGVTSETRRRE